MDNQSFSFIMNFNNVYCEVICDEGHFMVFFDGEYKCEVETGENNEWIICDGSIIEMSLVQEIGWKIDSYL